MTGSIRTLTTADGSTFHAWHCQPGDARRGGLVILHAIWGVTPHLRDLAENLAATGYEVLVPSLLDGGQPFPVLDIEPSRLAERMTLGEASGWGRACLPVVQAAIDALEGPVFAVGFCFGGTTAWLAATGCEGLAAVSSFYGGHIHLYRDRTPRCPTILHFGRSDTSIPMAQVDDIIAAQPDLPIWLYEADHAFVAPSGYHADSAKLAMLRTLKLFQRNSGVKAEA